MDSNRKNTAVIGKWLKGKNFYKSSILENEIKLREASEKKVLDLFHQAAKRVPAYRDFLQKNSVKPQKIKTYKDFSQLPILSKENYIEKYDIKSRCWDGSFESMSMISTSSGTTGKPHFWPRHLSSEIEGAYVHEFIFKEIFKLNEQKTLFINGFALGNWIAGTFTSEAVNLVAWKGYPITMMTPGYSMEAIIELLEVMAIQFEQTIITGHTPFLKEVVEEAIERRLDLEKLNIKLLGTGQGITEKWRNYMINLLKSKDYYHTFINLYGSADAALMGFETPVSIYLRRLISADIDKIRKIFKSNRLPSLYNFDPRLTFFEAIDGELHITKDYGCPLIRYNIHDEGGVFSYEEMSGYFSTHKSEMSSLNFPQWQLPFVYLFGRDKFMVKIYGANVYTEHVQQALDHERLQPFISGRFLLESSYDDEHNPLMVCRIELSATTQASAELESLIRQILIEEVCKLNAEYNDMLGRMGDKGKPKIILHPHGDPKYFPKDKIKKTA